MKGSKGKSQTHKAKGAKRKIPHEEKLKGGKGKK